MSIEEVAKSWLADPPWQKVFKHTLDVVEDYVSYVLITVGAIALSVRLLTTLSSGELACILIGVLNGTEPGDLSPYASGGTVGMINYAQTEQKCIEVVFSPFMEYLPYIMLLQTLILVIVEKFTFRIPRIAQKVERFYKNIVEDSLFGKDPDVTEDMTDPKTSTDSISRRRQRKEICVTLKRSNIIQRVYVGKNILECLLVIIFLPVNISYALIGISERSRCSIPILAFPGVVEEEGEVLFQCRGKKSSFFMMALWLQIFLLSIHLLLSIGCLIWNWYFRSVSSLYSAIESMKDPCFQPPLQKSNKEKGKDFLFLFDLLAHTCGLESTLRVLTHSDDNFYQICKPNFDLETDLKLEEDKLKISWKPADIERWLHFGKRCTRSQRSINMDSYEVTIFPAESVRNTQTISLIDSIELLKTKDGMANYYTWFYDLNGGRTEYVITIACMIGKSRMKGKKVVTNLVPYGPEKPRTGMLKAASASQVEIFWDPPKGDFTKYVLAVEKLSPPEADQKSLSNSEGNILRMTSIGSVGELDMQSLYDPSKVRKIENLSNKLQDYTIMGLEPGEKYRIELSTKTGTVMTRQKIEEIVMTKPLPVQNLMAEEIASNSCIIRWLVPAGHPYLKGFQIQVLLNDGKVVKSIAVAKAATKFKVSDLFGGNDYTVTVTSLCSSGSLRTESDPVKIQITTLPEAARNLRLESAPGPTSLNLRWDLSSLTSGNIQVRQKVIIEGVNFDYQTQIELAGDKTQYNFSKLPEPGGSGRMYKVSLWVCITQGESEVQSSPLTQTFSTPPHRPSNLRISKEDPGKCIIKWNKSQTPHVASYKVRWKSMEEGAKSEEATVAPGSAEEGNEKFEFSDLKPETVYKVNIYSTVTLPHGEVIESKELHGKVMVKDGQFTEVEQE